MKIVLATTAMTRGGVWRHVEDLALGLQTRGHRVVVALLPQAQALHAAANDADLPTAVFSEAVAWPGWVWHGHLHDTFDRAFLRATLRRRVIGPTVLTEHLPRTDASDPSLRPGDRHPLAGPAKTIFKRLQYRVADRVIAVSPSSKEFLIARYGHRWVPIEVVMNGIDRTSEPTLAGQREAPTRVVCVGSLIYQKGFDLLVDASEFEVDPMWHATVVGEGPAMDELVRRASSRSVVTFRGWSSDVANILSAADVACMPSRWESAPYAALEAMNAGLPVVAFDVDGLRDIVDHGVTGLLVEPENARALADALTLLAGDGARRIRMGRAAYARVLKFSRGRMVDEVFRTYVGVISTKRYERAAFEN